MWIFSILGFYSIACADKPGTHGIDPDTVMVRARVRKHLTNLQHRFPSLAETKILTLPGRDYGFRLIVPKSVWVEVLKELAEEQNWSNFKSQAAKNMGQTSTDYTSALHDVWEVMYGLQVGKNRRSYL